ncbi:MAG: hypothetical protein EA427_16425 [Spirochaetaceae bacterium]|nr:MAG: hypothetical protein EA427_16425 [Spirochaetaceae bacterium]
MSFTEEQDYLDYLDRQARVPRGFRFYRRSITFNAAERPGDEAYRMNLSYLHSDAVETPAAVMTTTNRFPGAPVILARERIAAGHLRGVLVNNKVANVGAETGLADARRLADCTAHTFAVPERQILSVSTGVIGWRLPVNEMESAIPRLPDSPCSPREFSQAIMTTDRYPKLAWSGGPGEPGPVMLGAAKGAGMVEPNLATMLVFFLTDAVVPPVLLDRVQRRVVNRSFNALSVDGDQSTSDMVVAMAGGASGVELNERDLETLWQPVADALALEIVRNGEGTSHVIEVIIRGCPDASLARKLGRHVVDSPLVKTAISGNDPNVGRILGALGDGLSRFDPEGRIDTSRLTIALAERVVYRDGSFVLNQESERILAGTFQAAAMDPVLKGYPQDRGTVPIIFDFRGEARESVRVLGSDLSHEYIRVNADYRT